LKSIQTDKFVEEEFAGTTFAELFEKTLAFNKHTN
jgi:hypothetical protein